MNHKEDVVIDKILNSLTFVNKIVLQGLLKFLYDSSVSGISLKETDIAIGYFKRGKEFIPGDDTIVRVNIYKLRALLEKYYKDEGKNDRLTIEIPKGSYLVQIREKGKSRPCPKLTSVSLIILILLLGISFIFNLLLLDRKWPHEGSNPIWASVFDKKDPVSIILGGPFFFSAEDTLKGSQLIMRDIHINSRQDLVKAKKDVQGKVLSELPYPYFSTANVLPLPDIISILSKGEIEVRLQSLSKTNIEDVKTNNIVFIANINSFGYMKTFLERTSIRLSDNPRKVSINHGEKESVLNVPDYINGSYLDYAILVKLPGSHNNDIIMMGDFHSSGIKGLSHYITNPSTVKKLKNVIVSKYGDFPEYFEMVVKVTSYNYVDFDTKMIYFKPLGIKDK